MGVGDKCEYRRCEKIVPPLGKNAYIPPSMKLYCSEKCRHNAASTRCNDIARGHLPLFEQTRKAMALIYELAEEVWTRLKTTKVCIYCEEPKPPRKKLICNDEACYRLYMNDYKSEWRRLGKLEKRNPNNRNPQRKRKQDGKDDNRQDDAR